MTGREYFFMIADYRDAVVNMKKLLDELRDDATAIGGFDYAKPIVQSTPKNITEEKIIKIADISYEFADKIAEWSRQILEAEKRLVLLSRPDYARILRMRYLDTRRHSWGWIAEEMGYDEDYVKKLHGKALEEFEGKFLKNN